MTRRLALRALLAPRRAPRTAGEPARSRTRSRIAAVVVGALVAAAALGGGSAFAYWTAGAVVRGTTSSASLSVSQSGADALTRTISHSRSSHTFTGSLTVTNTGESSGDIAVSVTAPSDAATIAGAFPITVWRASGNTASNCTQAAPVTGGAVISRFSSAQFTIPDVAAGSATVLCVRENLTENDVALLVANGISTSFTATVTVSIRTGTWTAQAPPTAITQQTVRLYPARESIVAVSGTSSWFQLKQGAGAGACLTSSLTSTTCTTDSNALWQLLPVSSAPGADASRVVIRPRDAPNMLLSAAGSSAVSVTDGTSALRALVSGAVSPPAAAQIWRVKQIDAGALDTGRILLISEQQGSCLSLATGGAPVLSDCASAATDISVNRIKLTADLGLLGLGLPFVVQLNSRVTGASMKLYRKSGDSWAPVSGVTMGGGSGLNTFSIGSGSILAIAEATQFELRFDDPLLPPAYTFSVRALLSLLGLIVGTTPSEGFG